MNPTRSAFLTVAWFAIASAIVPAQGTKEPPAGEEPPPDAGESQKDDPNKLAAELARLRMQLQRLTIDEERLLEVRIRHGLGLGTEGAAPFLVQEGERAAAGPGSERNLRDEEGQLTELSRRFDEMQRKVAADKARHPSPGDPEIPRHPERELGKKPINPRTGEPSTPQKGQKENRATESPTSRPQEPRRARPDSAPKLLVSGSTDRSTVGRVLFHAGRFKEAREELLEAVKIEPPDLQDHFLLGLCHERLGEPAKADDLYKKIEALDTKETPQGKAAGPWAEAARAASRQMSWMGDHGQWKLPRAIDSIEWRKGRR